VDTDDISETGDDGQVFESLGVEDESGIVAGVSGSLLGLDVEAGINDLERADVSLVVGLVGEGGIDDDSIDVLGLGGGH
jgi:hypothetical protein